MIAESLSRRYSKALFRTAKKHDLVSEIYANLEFFCDLIRKNRNFQYFYFSPRINISQKKDVLEKLFKDTFREEVLNFLLLLLDKKRQTIILRVEREYKTLMNNFLNKSEVSVISAYKLDRGEVEHIKTSLSENLKRDIEILEAVDPSILGGLILRINNNIIDASIEGQLKRMEKRLLK